jgi:quinoprotein glucose dehydrogenase
MGGITAGGLIFIGATQSPNFRAIDIGTGRDAWTTRLRAGGQATLMIYRSDNTGRHFAVILAGGNRALPSMTGDPLVAYALPTR